MDLASVYSCGQRVLNLPDLGSSRKQLKPIWKSPDTANIQQIQQIIPGFHAFLIEKTKVPACFPNYRGS